MAESENIEWPSLLIQVEMLLESLRSGFSRDVVQKIKDIVPEFQPENGGPKVPTQSLGKSDAGISRNLPHP